MWLTFHVYFQLRAETGHDLTRVTFRYVFNGPQCITGVTSSTVAGAYPDTVCVRPWAIICSLYSTISLCVNCDVSLTHWILSSVCVCTVFVSVCVCLYVYCMLSVCVRVRAIALHIKILIFTVIHLLLSYRCGFSVVKVSRNAVPGPRRNRRKRSGVPQYQYPHRNGRSGAPLTLFQTTLCPEKQRPKCFFL